LIDVRAVILTNRSGNQIALVSKLMPHVDVAAVVFSKNIPRHRPAFSSRVKTLSNGLASRSFGRPFREAWNQMLLQYSEMYPNVSISRSIDVNNVNDEATLSAIEKYSPDLVLVSGTNIVGSKIIDTAHKFGKIMNLHTGISPYVKGGPNCTNWCLAKRWFHLIGNTVMWIDKGIDTGNIIATERTVLDGSESLFQLHWKVMEHAHEMYVKAVRYFSEGKALPDIPQKDITRGELFLSSQWNSFSMQKARFNFNRYYASYFMGGITTSSEQIRIFPLQ
jgi:folate-dependent phosphoribosylglycinamide formyltransferase PurN